MKHITHSLGMASIALSTAGVAQAGTLTLQIDTGDANGQVLAAIFDSQTSFDDRSPVAGVIHPVNGGVANITFDALAPGAYGVAVFLDTNGNRELDRDSRGAPTEPYGFSMDPEIGFAAPSFDAFSFDHEGNDQQLTIRLTGN